MSLPDRFMSKVKVDERGCWLWTAFRDRSGYGRYGTGEHRSAFAHRFAYEQTNGPVPDGLELDHICRARHCVNPWHVEPVTHMENLRRGEQDRGGKTRSVFLRWVEDKRALANRVAEILQADPREVEKELWP